MLEITINNRLYQVEQKNEHWLVNGKTVNVDWSELGQNKFSALINGRSYEGWLEGVNKKDKQIHLSLNNETHELNISEPIDQLIKTLGIEQKNNQKNTTLKAPMPGLVFKILTSVGAEVKKGDGLLILEAMKMENVLKSPTDGIVQRIEVAEKTAVEKGTLLIEIN